MTSQPKRPDLAAHLFPAKDFEQKDREADLPEQNKNRRMELCLETLIKGHVNSFVDFFFLTHRSEEEGVASRPPIPDDQLKFVQATLTTAERAHRRGDSERVFVAYDSLAQYFLEMAEYKTAIYFFEKCLDIAESTDDLAQQGNSTLSLGITHDNMGDIVSAIRFHERHLKIAGELGDQERLNTANRQLLEVYKRRAEELEKKNDYASAVELYKKCLQASKAAGDLRAEGVACYRLGVSYSNLEQKDESIRYQQYYLELCGRTDDQLGEGAACAALAHSFKSMGDLKLAIKYLDRYLDIATRNKQAVAQAEACSALGTIYSEAGEHDKAVSFFEQAFELARSVGDRKLLDAARINLGMAKGNLAMGNYMGVVKSDLPALINWKTRRINF